MIIEKGKLYLITGATGFLGEHLTERVLALGGRVRALSRNEGKLIVLKQRHPSVEIYTGDVSDWFEVKQAMLGVNAIFHLAASKHVGLAETYSRECTKTNVVGSLNILEESLQQNFDFVIGISTDKAAQVSGVYGATKLLMEKAKSKYKIQNCQIWKCSLFHGIGVVQVERLTFRRETGYCYRAKSNKVFLD